MLPAALLLLLLLLEWWELKPLTTTAAMIDPIQTEHTRLAAALILVPRWLLGDDITDTTRNNVATTHD